ncbi:DprA-like DNA processing chain A [Mycobacterium phage Noelle]|uniref:DprA-like DNA processing chain A n=1 Tax=Mycobacterium phage Noelle TaxID=2572317 RepID=A0A6B9LEC2_9CAUD|nr:DprA-like DNA processing chain A [Mycobacterium phage Noelle]QHB38088.1 DprA-like DNA processing chain A [Mycobacterium phage Noelle]
MRRVLVTGSRDWRDRPEVWRTLQDELDKSPDGIVVVHGAARGADDIADRWAWGMHQMGYKVEPEDHPADWDKYGKAAGHIRNREMVNLGADVCHAFPLEFSIGTFGCMRLAREAGIEVINHGYIKEPV